MKKKELLEKVAVLEEQSKRNYGLYYTICWNLIGLIDVIDQEGKETVKNEKKETKYKQLEVERLIDKIECLTRSNSASCFLIFYADLQDKFAEFQFDSPSDKQSDDYDDWKWQAEKMARYIDVLEWLLSCNISVHTCKRWGMCFTFCNGKVPDNKFRSQDKFVNMDIIVGIDDPMLGKELKPTGISHPPMPSKPLL